ncbi:hypothetical protein FMEXI_10271 [Fusarium mexicanum]|uniref:Uncharacterized protein n=1 Tax=Fusarium mexicanum TaxID=751941 RepID=A0A8H5IL17_9HYPO|nr:hypothetical protein FMEXI_10271 [Fusarium mexicanum]
MSSYSGSREEGRDPGECGLQYSSYGDDNLAPQWDSNIGTPEWVDEAPSHSYTNDRDLRRDLHRAQRTSLRLLDAQKESTERIRELQDNNYGLEEEVANMRAQLAFATGTIINKIQDKVDAATFAGSTVRALRQQITDQTETIENLKIQKRKAFTELAQLQLQRKKKKTSSSNKAKSEKGKSGNHSAPSDANAALDPSLITAPGQAQSLIPSAQDLMEKYLVEDVVRDRVIRDVHFTSGVEAQLQKALLKASAGRNLRGFLIEARLVVTIAFTRCQLGGDKCSFLMKAVGIGSHRKVQIYNAAVGTSA